MHLGPDKAPKQIRAEISTKILTETLCSQYPSKNIQPVRSMAMVTMQWTELVAINHPPQISKEALQQPLTLKWDETVAAKREVDNEIITNRYNTAMATRIRGNRPQG